MKISELLRSITISRAMLIPVAIAKENRSITLGQLIDALAASVALFDRIDEKVYAFDQTATAPATVAWPIVYRPKDNKFYGLSVQTVTAAGITSEHAVFYPDFIGKELFYDDNGAIRTDCLFLSRESRLYRYDGAALTSAGITQAQAEQLQLLTPKEVASETELQAMEEAGLIKPGQLYYIPEND